MKKALWKDSVREIRLSIARFVCIFAIVFVGVAFFAGIKSTAPDMKYSVDMYYDEYDMADIRVLSTLGLTDSDMAAIENIEGINKVRACYFCDATVVTDTSQYVYKIHSIPAESVKDDQVKYINRPKIIEGRYPQKSGECVIESPLYVDMELGIGDVIKLDSGKEESITESTLRTDEFTIVGIAISPYYLSYERGTSDIGSGKANFFMMILDEDFILPCYTEALVTVKNAKELNCYKDEYSKLIESITAPLENLGVERTQIRIDDIRDAANAELEEARKTYEDEKKRYDNEITNGENELENAKLELVEAQATLDANKENFYTYYNESYKQINDAQSKLDDAEDDYYYAVNQYNAVVETYGEDLETLDETTQQLNQHRADAQETLDGLYLQLNSSDLSDEEKKSIEELIAYYEEYITMVDDQLETLNNLNDLSQGQMENMEQQLSSTKKELDSQARDLAYARSDLTSSKEEAEEEFEAAQQAIDEGWVEYHEGMKDLESKKKEGKQELDDALTKINDAQKEVDRLKKPQWYVLSREQMYSYVNYRETADRIDAIVQIFPAFFFIVASLVCLTTMTRMVDEQRGNIGTYKALGYKNRMIIAKYVLYASIASLMGGICGLFAGIKVFPRVIYNAWTMMYTLPEFKQTPHIVLMLSSVIVGILVTSMAAAASCSASLKVTPSVLMRPKSPKPGKKIFLERIKNLWKQLSFSQKVTIRNLFRYKKRFAMTIIGIIGCSALLLAGFGLSDSISQVVDKQYKEIFTYHINVEYNEFAKEEEKQNIISLLDSDENIRSYQIASKINAETKVEDAEVAVSLIVPIDKEGFKDYVTLRRRINGKPITLTDKGMVITEKLAKELKVSTGDFVEVSNEKGVMKKAMVTGITENYVFHYAYMSKEYYGALFFEEPEVNNVMIKLIKANDETESALGGTLISNDAVSSVEYYSTAINTFSDTVKILNNIVIVIIISAGLLALVVIYNLTNINICERIREIATFKVLGFYPKEVGSYVYRENEIIGGIGALIGLFLGTVLHKFIMDSLEQDGVMFGNYINPISFLYAIVITMGFVVLVNLIMYRKIKNIPMIESLKSVE